MPFRSEITSVPDVRTKIGRVVRVINGMLDVATLGGNAVFRGIRCSGVLPVVGDRVLVAFHKNNEVVATPVSSSDPTTAPVSTLTINTGGGGGGAGTVNSVGLSMPGIFAVANSPIISSGTIAVALNAQPATYGLFGPAAEAGSGSSTPTFRRINVKYDLDWSHKPGPGIYNGVLAPNDSGDLWIEGTFTGGQSAKQNISVSPTTGLTINNNGVERFGLDASGVMTIKDGTGAAVFTFDATTGAEFTKPLTLGAAGGIWQGTGTFSSPTTGLKIWNASGVGKIAGYKTGVAQWYADSDGIFKAAAGQVQLDVNGISLANNMLWTDTGASTSTLRAFIGAPFSDIAADFWQLSFPGWAGRTQVITLVADRVEARTVDFEGAFIPVWMSAAWISTAGGGTAYIQSGASGTPTLTLPISTGTLALTSDITAAVAGTVEYIPKFTSANVIGNSILYLSSNNILTAAGNSGLMVNPATGSSTVAIESNSVDSIAQSTLAAYGSTLAKSYVTAATGTSQTTVLVNHDGPVAMYRTSGNAASLKIRGVGAGYNIFSPPNVGADVTHTLPSATGTLAQLADITTAVAGTIGTIPKFTGTNAIGNSVITESGAAIAVAGSVQTTAAGIYIGGATSPANVELQRTLGAAATSYVEIGSLDITAGAHNLRISVTVAASGHSIAKQFDVSTKYAQTGGAWHTALPVSDSGLYNYDFDLIVNQTATSLALRLFQRVGASNADVHYVRIESVGISTDVFTGASGSGTMTAPSVALASSMDFKAKALYLSRTIPTTVGNYVGIGAFAGTPLGHILEVDISNSDGGFTVAKHHVFTSTYAEAGSNAIVAPISSTGVYSSGGGQDYALVAVQSGSGVTLYLLRTVGTTAGTATVAIRYSGAPSVAFTESTATGSMTVPTIYYPSALLSQVDGGVRVLGGYLSYDMDTMTYATTISLDVTKPNFHKTTTVNATGNATINASGGGVAGQPMTILIVNDATSGKVITFGTNFKPNGTLTGTTSKGATVGFMSDGTSWWEVSRTLVL